MLPAVERIRKHSVRKHPTLVVRVKANLEFDQCEFVLQRPARTPVRLFVAPIALSIAIGPRLALAAFPSTTLI
jgi:hypothetical protein